MRWAPLLFLPAPVHSGEFGSFTSGMFEPGGPSFPLADSRLTPHYPAKSPLDDVLRYLEPGSDEFVTEKYAAEIARRLEEWGRELRSGRSGANVLARLLDPSFQAASLRPIQENKLRSEYGIETVRRTFSSEALGSRERFLKEMQGYLAPLTRVDTAEFQIAGIEQTTHSPPQVRIHVRYDLVGQREMPSARSASGIG